MCQTEGTPLGDASNKGLGPKMQNHQLSWWIFIVVLQMGGKMEVQDLLEYVNSELANGSNLTKFAKGLGKNESTIRKKLNKAGYKRVGNKFVLNVDTTRSTTRYEENKLGHMPHNNIYSMKADISKIEANIDIEKLRLLVENIDNLLRLIPNTTSSITSISINTEKTKVTSLRINEDIYNLIKERAVRDKCSISDIVNKSLMDYLNNYL